VAVTDVYTLENLPRLRSLVQHHATTDPADLFLVTLAGDFVAPSVLSSLDAGRGMVACMNAVGVTHAILGNHEDDIPTGELRQRVAELRAAVLGTNVRGFTPALPAHDVLEARCPDGRTVRLGLVGVVMDDPTVYRHVPFGGAELSPPNPAAQLEALHLVRDLGCACVVAMTHQPIELDRQLAEAQQSPPFPLILGGHEHVPFLEQVGGTWIAKAGADAVHAIVVDLVWPALAPEDGPDLPTVGVHLEDVATYPEDAELRVRVEGHMAQVHQLEGASLMHLPEGEVLSSVGTRVRQTSMGTLLCTRIRDALGAEACLFNGGGIRGSREYRRHLAFGDLKAEVPFDNEIVVARLPGSVVAEAVASTRAHAPAESGGYLQVDDRMSVAEPRQTVTHIDGKPIVEGREYRVALVRDLFGGLDHIEPLVRFAKANPASVPPAGSGRDVKLVLVDAFSRALWRQLGGFDAVDANHDGMVTEPEVEAAIARATSEAPSALVAHLVIDALDANHDEMISRSEARAAEPDVEAAAPALADDDTPRVR
jgi:2',3'-cyclic-nucleotide 2'-phosphodiesterase (5'-nucleotidase family)